MSLARLGTGFRTRLPLKSAFVSALALTTLAGSVALSGGEAKALTCPFGGSGLISPFCITGVWYNTNPVATDKQINFIQGPTANRGGNIEWMWVDTNMNGTWRIPPDPHSVDTWHVDVDYNPPLMSPPDGPSLFRYFIRITEPGYGFEDVTLTSSMTAGTGSVTKMVYASMNQTIGEFLGTLTVTPNSGPQMLNLYPDKLPSLYKELYIIDTATPGTSVIDNYQNIYRQVPGPLPILGAGAAFGFTRKLKRRIKANSAA